VAQKPTQSGAFATKILRGNPTATALGRDGGYTNYAAPPLNLREMQRRVSELTVGRGRSQPRKKKRTLFPGKLDVKKRERRAHRNCEESTPPVVIEIPGVDSNGKKQERESGAWRRGGEI